MPDQETKAQQSSYVDTLHPLLDAKTRQIRRCRDAYMGTDSIKLLDGNLKDLLSKTDEEYLPRLSGQSDDQYAQYKVRAVFYAAMARTVIALVGAIDRKCPEIKGAEGLEEWMKDVTGYGVSFEEFMKDIETEVLISGRVNIVIDRMNSVNNTPYLVWSKNEDCINWFTEDASEFDKKLSSMVFREAYTSADKDNPYLQNQSHQYREYLLDPAGNVVVKLWRPLDKALIAGAKTDYTVHETYNVTNRGRALGFLPVVSVVSEGSPLEIPKPPLVDLVDVSLSHYRNSADYEHGLHWTALPTPWFSGLNDRSSAITIGSGTAIVLPDPASKAGFLEFSGVGLSAIAQSMKVKENMMSALGARMLGSSMDQSTSAEVVRINVAGEVAALQNIAKSLSRGLTRLLRMVAIWENKSNPENIDIRLNEDYIDTKLAAQDITALMQAYQAGVISLDSLLWNFDQGERLPLGRTVDEEMAMIEADLDKEADLAKGYGDEKIGYEGNNFSAPPLTGIDTSVEDEDEE
jgi:hypothetical protein